MSSQSWPKYPVAHASLDTLTTCTKHTDHCQLTACSTSGGPQAQAAVPQRSRKVRLT